MKVDSPALVNQTIKVITSKNALLEPSQPMTSKLLQAPINPVRLNLERYAEEMEPDDYIKMRSYLSDIEMHQLFDSGMF